MATQAAGGIVMSGVGPLVIHGGGELQTVRIEVALKEAAKIHGYRKPLQTFFMKERGSGPRRNIERPGT